MLVKLGYRVSLDLPLLSIKHKGDPDNDIVDEMGKRASKAHFDQVENAGTEVSYRCTDCRNCNKCKSSENTEFVSMQEEIEQDIIDKCAS